MIRWRVQTMKVNDAVAGMLAAFEGRHDVRGADDDGNGHPGPVASDPTTWRQAMHSHLYGRMGIGVYPIQDDEVLWGCVDFDDGEIASQEHAYNLTVVLAEYEITAWIERSRSKGYHVWCFAPEWVPAKLMRRALLAACQIAEVPNREVNPKSEHLDPDEYGNFVRLPYFGDANGAIQRQVMLHPLTFKPIPLHVFLANMERDATRGRLTALAKDLRLPKARQPRVWEHTDTDRPWHDRLNALARTFVDDGPREDNPRVSGRSGYLMATANVCAASGLDWDELVDCLRWADARHCQKFTNRPDAQKRYEEMATKALDQERENVR